MVAGGLTCHDKYGTARLKMADRIYIASRASIPERAAGWRKYRANGVDIVSSWIDEAGEGQTADFGELWARIWREIASCNRLVLYAEPGDFPLKGALVEVGMALAMEKPIVACLPGVTLEGRTFRPIGSWIAAKSVTRNDSIMDVMFGERGGELTDP